MVTNSKQKSKPTKDVTMLTRLDSQSPNDPNFDPVPFNASDVSPLTMGDSNRYFSKLQHGMLESTTGSMLTNDSRRSGERQTTFSFQGDNSQTLTFSEQGNFPGSFQMTSNDFGDQLLSPLTNTQSPSPRIVQTGANRWNNMTILALSPLEEIESSNPQRFHFNPEPIPQNIITSHFRPQQSSTRRIQPPTPASSFFTRLHSSSLEELPMDIPIQRNARFVDTDNNLNGRNIIVQPLELSQDNITRTQDTGLYPDIDSAQQPTFRSHQTDNWMGKYRELLDFRKRYGHCLVPNAFKENPPLAEWVKRQRYQYKLKGLGEHSTMCAERIESLEKLGFVWNSHDQIWEERLRDLKQFRNMFGHCHVPSRYGPDPQLAIWVKRQRRQYKFLIEGKTSTMTPCRIHKLNEIEFAWSGRKLSSPSSSMQCDS